MPKVKTDQVMIRMDRQVKRRLQQVAADEDRTMSAVIRRAIAADLDRRQEGIAA